MARVSRQFDLIVFNNVLFDDCVSVASKLRLLNCQWIEVGLGNESIVAWNVGRCFGCAHSQLVVLIGVSVIFLSQFVRRLASVSSKRLRVFSVEVASL